VTVLRSVESLTPAAAMPATATRPPANAVLGGLAAQCNGAVQQRGATLPPSAIPPASAATVATTAAQAAAAAAAAAIVATATAAHAAAAATATSATTAPVAIAADAALAAPAVPVCLPPKRTLQANFYLFIIMQEVTVFCGVAVSMVLSPGEREVQWRSGSWW